MIQVVHQNIINTSPHKTYIDTIIDSKSGCKNLKQSILYLKNKSIKFPSTKLSQKTAYILEGEISLITLNQNSYKEFILQKGSAFLINNDIEIEIKNMSKTYSSILMTQSPQEEYQTLSKAKINWNNINIIPIVHSKNQPPIPAGRDRYFKLLIDPEFGSKYVTQFLGYIKKVKAPFHEHTYEEVIYIIKGEGLIHYNNKIEEIKEGSSIYLSPGTIHRLENKNSKVELELLGVFCPAGSPADKQESNE